MAASEINANTLHNRIIIFFIDAAPLEYESSKPLVFAALHHRHLTSLPHGMMATRHYDAIPAR
jgi:hypothetical protein